MDIKISIIDICYANTTRYLKLWWFLYFINEKFKYKCESLKIDQKAGEKSTPYRFRSFTQQFDFYNLDLKLLLHLSTVTSKIQ